MKLAVIGSRTFADYPLLVETLNKVKTPITCLVSGGARGADALAEAWAKRRGIPTQIFLPDYNAHGRRAPLERNKLIVAEADNVLAFWDGVSTGTMQAVNHAKALGKTCHIIQFANQ